MTETWNLNAWLSHLRKSYNSHAVFVDDMVNLLPFMVDSIASGMSERSIDSYAVDIFEQSVIILRDRADADCEAESIDDRAFRQANYMAFWIHHDLEHVTGLSIKPESILPSSTLKDMPAVEKGLLLDSDGHAEVMKRSKLWQWFTKREYVRQILSLSSRTNYILQNKRITRGAVVRHIGDLTVEVLIDAKYFAIRLPSENARVFNEGDVVDVIYQFGRQSGARAWLTGPNLAY